MRLLENKAYIEFSEMLQCGFNENYLKKAKSAGTKCWEFINDPDDRRRVLVGYEALKDDNKAKVQAVFGNPYEYLAKAPIRALVTKDFKAEAFFCGHQLTAEDKLPLKTQERYANEAAWLNMIINACDNAKKVIKDGLKLSIDQFFTHVRELLEIEITTNRISAKFPTSYSKLRAKMAAYKAGGYAALISSAFGNKSAAKVCDEESTQKLFGLLDDPLQRDDVYVTFLYNQWAAQSGYKEIDVATVGLHRRKWHDLLTPGREGWGAFNEKYIRQVKGTPGNTMHPLALVESDDYSLNYYFSDEHDSTSSKNFKRYVSYVVADSSLGLVLGGCYRQAKAPTFEMVQIAWLDAMYYIRSLANDGNWYCPLEVKADHWQKTLAFPYFKGIANFVPPMVKNKHRGYIEPLFGTPHFKRAEKLAADKALNYNGNNMTAVHRGHNVEVLAANEKHRPQIGDPADQQLQKFIWITRNMPAFTRNDMNAPSKQQQWLDRWNNTAENQKRPITDMQFLLKFGIKHQPQGRTISITNRGVEPVICGKKYSYDLPDYTGMQNYIGTPVTVVYDPFDMSRVLITDFNRIRFIAREATLQPRSLAYAYDGSRHALNMVLEEKKAQVKNTAGKVSQLSDSTIDAEAIFLAGFMRKELLAEAVSQLPHYGPQVEELQQPVPEGDGEPFNVHQYLLNH